MTVLASMSEFFVRNYFHRVNDALAMCPLYNLVDIFHECVSLWLEATPLTVTNHLSVSSRQVTRRCPTNYRGSHLPECNNHGPSGSTFTRCINISYPFKPKGEWSHIFKIVGDAGV